MDGCEATRIIRRREVRGAWPRKGDPLRPACREAARVPIIAITTNPRNGDRCLASGMAALLPKPFDEAQLREALGRWRMPAIG